VQGVVVGGLVVVRDWWGVEMKTRVRIIIMLWFPEGHGFSPMGFWDEKKRAKITFTRDHHE